MIMMMIMQKFCHCFYILYSISYRVGEMGGNDTTVNSFLLYFPYIYTKKGKIKKGKILFNSNGKCINNEDYECKSA